ncbi:MAG TPA: superoxide dismutase [Ktedonobacterales bacterium]
MTYELPPLPYDYNALEPYIDEETMHLHHDKHHQAYVNNLNTAMQNAPANLQNLPVDELMTRINDVPESIRQAVINNGGGHSNHSMFWIIMTPGGPKEPQGELAQAIQQTFGSVDNLKNAINDAGAKRFGSGWTWLVMNPNGQLEVISTANQDSPLMKGQYPILGNDVWEHAYYLKYQNRRPDYLNAWWNVLNWNEAGKRYQQAKQRSGAQAGGPR